MTDQQIPIVYMEQIESNSFSTDEATALVIMSDRQGSKFGIMMAVEQMATLQHVLAGMRKRHARRDMATGLVIQNFPQSFAVGHPQDKRGCVAITFDEMQPNETVYLLPDDAGLNLAEALEQNILSRMTPAQRHARARSRHPLLMPINPKIVTP